MTSALIYEPVRMGYSSVRVFNRSIEVSLLLKHKYHRFSTLTYLHHLGLII